MKKDGQTCWVSTGSKRCLATSSTDTAPMLIALGAEIVLKSEGGERKLPLADLYLDDGIDYHARRHDEILASVSLPGQGEWRSTYWKLRRRGSFDFAVLSVAAAGCREDGDRLSQVRLVLGAVASQPVLCEAANAFLQDKPLSDEVIQEASTLAARAAKPVKNTDFAPHWRRQMVTQMASCALRELRGDDMLDARRRFARQALQ
jgi:4-hydroxybenzoyl-CoA reductase subunit beta